MRKLILCITVFLSSLCQANNALEGFRNQTEKEAIDYKIVTFDDLDTLMEHCSRSKHSKKIWFVNNTNTSHGSGSYKNPFNNLLAAQNASKRNDIIFVFPGDNTTKGMDQGFIMKKGQRLLGAGVDHKIDYAEHKLIVRAASSSLPLLTNSANGSGVTLADSTEVSGFHILNIRGGNGILGGDNNPVAPTTVGIKRTHITKNIISNMNVLNGAIYLPNCRGKLVIRDNTIFNIQPINSKTGIQIVNENVPVYSHVIITKNRVSNNANTGITVSHNSPRGVVKASVEHNTVFNIGTAGDAIFTGTQGTSAGGRLFVNVVKNFCQNSVAHDLNIQSSGTSFVQATVKKNTLVVSSLVGLIATSQDSSHLCLKLEKNISDTGYSLEQRGASLFNIQLHRNIGLPFTTTGNITEGKCHHHSH
jgi:hypothetical protein